MIRSRLMASLNSLSPHSLVFQLLSPLLLLLLLLPIAYAAKEITIGFLDDSVAPDSQRLFEVLSEEFSGSVVPGGVLRLQRFPLPGSVGDYALDTYLSLVPIGAPSSQKPPSSVHVFVASPPLTLSCDRSSLFLMSPPQHYLAAFLSYSLFRFESVFFVTEPTAASRSLKAMARHMFSGRSHHSVSFIEMANLTDFSESQSGIALLCPSVGQCAEVLLLDSPSTVRLVLPLLVASEISYFHLPLFYSPSELPATGSHYFLWDLALPTSCETLSSAPSTNCPSLQFQSLRSGLRRWLSAVTRAGSLKWSEYRTQLNSFASSSSDGSYPTLLDNRPMVPERPVRVLRRTVSGALSVEHEMASANTMSLAPVPFSWSESDCYITPVLLRRSTSPMGVTIRLLFDRTDTLSGSIPGFLDYIITSMNRIGADLSHLFRRPRLFFYLEVFALSISGDDDQLLQAFVSPPPSGSTISASIGIGCLSPACFTALAPFLESSVFSYFFPLAPFFSNSDTSTVVLSAPSHLAILSALAPRVLAATASIPLPRLRALYVLFDKSDSSQPKDAKKLILDVLGLSPQNISVQLFSVEESIYPRIQNAFHSESSSFLVLNFLCLSLESFLANVRIPEPNSQLLFCSHFLRPKIVVSSPTDASLSLSSLPSSQASESFPSNTYVLSSVSLATLHSFVPTVLLTAPAPFAFSALDRILSTVRALMASPAFSSSSFNNVSETPFALNDILSQLIVSSSISGTVTYNRCQRAQVSPTLFLLDAIDGSLDPVVVADLFLSPSSADFLYCELEMANSAGSDPPSLREPSIFSVTSFYTELGLLIFSFVSWVLFLLFLYIFRNSPSFNPGTRPFFISLVSLSFLTTLFHFLRYCVQSQCTLFQSLTDLCFFGLYSQYSLRFWKVSYVISYRPLKQIRISIKAQFLVMFCLLLPFLIILIVFLSLDLNFVVPESGVCHPNDIYTICTYTLRFLHILFSVYHSAKSWATKMLILENLHFAGSLVIQILLSIAEVVLWKVIVMYPTNSLVQSVLLFLDHFALILGFLLTKITGHNRGGNIDNCRTCDGLSSPTIQITSPIVTTSNAQSQSKRGARDSVTGPKRNRVMPDDYLMSSNPPVAPVDGRTIVEVLSIRPSFNVQDDSKIFPITNRNSGTPLPPPDPPVPPHSGSESYVPSENLRSLLETAPVGFKFVVH